MRRKDKEITTVKDKLAIVEKCKVCRVGLCDNNQPYVVPLNYGYSFQDSKLTLYFHSAKDGKKTDMINNNHKACFEIDCDTKLIEGETACRYNYEFKSIIGFGEIQMLETAEEKKEGLNRLMKHQTGKDSEFTFEDREVEKVLVYKMEVTEFTGKIKTE